MIDFRTAQLFFVYSQAYMKMNFLMK